MKKNFFVHLMSAVMVAIMCVGFASCEKDDKDDNEKTGKIVGLVSDFANANTPIAGATVTLVQQGDAKVTGADGRFEFSNLKPGSYTIAVAANNFQVTTQMAYVYAGESSHCDFQLQRTSQNVEITPMSLTFGKNIDQLSFYIVNNTNQLLTYSFSNVPDYLQITPSAGTVAAKGRQAIIASIPNRSKVSTTGTQIVIVNIGSDSYALTITMTNSTVTPPDPDPDPDPDQDPEPTTGDVTRGILAYYNFDDGTAKNASGTQNNGVINGDAQFIIDTPNGKGKALFLDQEQYVNIARNPLEGKTSLTISMWVKDFGIGYLFTTINDRGYKASIAIHSNGKVNCGKNEWNEDKTLEYKATSLQSSGWHMLTLVQKNAISEFYVDGEIVDSKDFTYTNTIDGTKMQIGGRAEDNNIPWADPFKVDNVRVYGVALTEEEVAQLYNYEKK